MQLLAIIFHFSVKRNKLSRAVIIVTVQVVILFLGDLFENDTFLQPDDMISGMFRIPFCFSFDVNLAKTYYLYLHTNVPDKSGTKRAQMEFGTQIFRHSFLPKNEKNIIESNMWWNNFW